MVASNYLLLYSYHTYVQCKHRGIGPFVCSTAPERQKGLFCATLARDDELADFLSGIQDGIVAEAGSLLAQRAAQ